MTLCFSRTLTFILLFCIPVLRAQENTALIWENEIDLNAKLSETVSLNIGSAYRNEVSDGLTNTSFDYESKHLQFSTNVSTIIGFYGKISGGIMFRFNTIENSNNENELRLSQQYSYSKRFNAFRIVHRAQLDERIRSASTVWRLRYRLSGDLPLNGLKLDKGEFYLVISTESLLSVSSRFRPEWDQRFTIALGNQLMDKIKIQLDTEYRIEDYLGESNKRLFVVTGLIYKW